jgi:hypothetical protein
MNTFQELVTATCSIVYAEDVTCPHTPNFSPENPYYLAYPRLIDAHIGSRVKVLALSYADTLTALGDAGIKSHLVVEGSSVTIPSGPQTVRSLLQSVLTDLLVSEVEPLVAADRAAGEERFVKRIGLDSYETYLKVTRLLEKCPSRQVAIERRRALNRTDVQVSLSNLLVVLGYCTREGHATVSP